MLTVIRGTCLSSTGIVSHSVCLSSVTLFKILHFFQFFQVLSSPFQSIQFIPSPFRPFQVLSSPIKSFQVLSNPFKSFQVLSSPFKSFQVLSNPFKSSQALSLCAYLGHLTFLFISE